MRKFGRPGRASRRRLSPGIPHGTDAALLVLRVVAGLLIAYHGVLKIVGGVPHFAMFIAAQGIPLPGFTSWVVALLELVGGVLVAAGLLTRPLALLLAVEMLLTTLVIKLPGPGVIGANNVAGAELDLLYLASFVALMLSGPGRWSVDNTAGFDRARP
jgi:putative oxidoreductase